MPKVSVIVPIYNGSKYLDRCLNSIMKQTLNDIEIILVDDGSIDNSGVMCDQYAQKDGRIVSIHKKNGGLGSARNCGLKYVKSEYVGFVDCDDWVNPDTYEFLYKNAINNDADISSGKFAIIHSENSIIKPEKQVVNIYEKIEKQKVYIEIGIKNRSSQYSVCTKIYRRKLFDMVSFPEGQLYEDVVTNFQLLGLANRFVLSNKYVYNYYMESTGITRNKCSNRDLDLIKVGKQIEKLTEGTEIENLGKIMSARTNFSLLVKSQIYGFDDSVNDRDDLTHDWLTEIRKNYKLMITSNMPISRKVVLIGYRCFPLITKNIFCLVRKIVALR